MGEKLPMQVVSAEARQADIEHHSCGSIPFDTAQGVQSVLDSNSLETGTGQRRTIKLTKLGIVFDNENRRPLRKPLQALPHSH